MRIDAECLRRECARQGLSEEGVFLMCGLEDQFAEAVTANGSLEGHVVERLAGALGIEPEDILVEE